MDYTSWLFRVLAGLSHGQAVQPIDDNSARAYHTNVSLIERPGDFAVGGTPGVRRSLTAEPADTREQTATELVRRSSRDNDPTAIRRLFESGEYPYKSPMRVATL